MMIQTAVAAPPSFDHLLALRIIGYDVGATVSPQSGPSKDTLHSDTAGRSITVPEEKIFTPG